MLPPAPTLGFAVNSEGSVLAALGVVEAWGFGVARALAAKRAAAAYLDGDMVVIDVHWLLVCSLLGFIVHIYIARAKFAKTGILLRRIVSVSNRAKSL